MKKAGGFFKYWWIMFQCVGFSGIILMGMWPKNSKPDYIAVWNMKD